jgi:hypothetical protein
MRRFSIWSACLLATLVAAPGCGGKKYENMVAVEGKVLFKDGKPLPKGTRLYFHPATGKMGTATAITEEDGTFRLVHESGFKGTAIGKYAVQLAAPENDKEAFFKIVPKDFYEGTGALTADVKEPMGKLSFEIPKNAAQSGASLAGRR